MAIPTKEELAKMLMDLGDSYRAIPLEERENISTKDYIKSIEVLRSLIEDDSDDEEEIQFKFKI